MKKDIKIENWDDYVSQFRCPIITVYNKNTKDYKGKYVARLFNVEARKVFATTFVDTDENIEEIRKKKPNYMLPVPRSEQDDENIIESWI